MASGELQKCRVVFFKDRNFGEQFCLRVRLWIRRIIISAMHPFFETGSVKYAWPNGIICISKGKRLPKGPEYQVYQIL